MHTNTQVTYFFGILVYPDISYEQQLNFDLFFNFQVPHKYVFTNSFPLLWDVSACLFLENISGKFAGCHIWFNTQRFSSNLQDQYCNDYICTFKLQNNLAINFQSLFLQTHSDKIIWSHSKVHEYISVSDIQHFFALN